MPGVCFWMLLAASIFPATATAQDTAYNEALAMPCLATLRAGWSKLKVNWDG
jgi:hypothetical protein